MVVGVALSTLPLGGAAVAFLGLVAFWFGLYLFMRESAKTIRWFATPMIAVFGWFVLVSGSGSLARWTPNAEVVAASRAEAVQATTSGADLHADVRLTGAQFLVTNNGQTPWTEIVFTLTGSDAKTYTLRMDRIEAGRTTAIQLPRFTTPDSHPFRMATTKPQALTLEAQGGNSGRGTYTVRWRS